MGTRPLVRDAERAEFQRGRKAQIDEWLEVRTKRNEPPAGEPPSEPAATLAATDERAPESTTRAPPPDDPMRVERAIEWLVQQAHESDRRRLREELADALRIRGVLGGSADDIRGARLRRQADPRWRFRMRRTT